MKKYTEEQLEKLGPCEVCHKLVIEPTLFRGIFYCGDCLNGDYEPIEPAYRESVLAEIEEEHAKTQMKLWYYLVDIEKADDNYAGEILSIHKSATSETMVKSKERFSDRITRIMKTRWRKRIHEHGYMLKWEEAIQ
jgi:hypothetical protein